MRAVQGPRHHAVVHERRGREQRAGGKSRVSEWDSAPNGVMDSVKQAVLDRNLKLCSEFGWILTFGTR